MASSGDVEVASPPSLTPRTKGLYIQTEQEDEAYTFATDRRMGLVRHANIISDAYKSPFSEPEFQNISSRSSSSRMSVTPDTPALHEIPKASKRTLKKDIPPPAPTFLHLPDNTREAIRTFELLENCTYANKYIGRVDDALDCDCKVELGKDSCPSNKFVSGC